jgi:ABC-2 type transport system ATP-binding protein
MLVLEVQELAKRYRGGVTALERLSFSLAGGAVGLLGPNGAGKSSLVKILLGLVPPTSGRAALFGLDCARFPLQIRQQVGYLPENESFIPGLDAVSYVCLAGRLVGMPHDDAMQRTHVVLNYVGLDEQRYRKIETYSTGMKQKVKFAQALVHHPRLLLLDEPTSGLDPHGREEMLALIKDISHGKGIHVVLSTHILPDVEATCDEVVILDRGRLVRQGKLSDLRAGDQGSYDVRVKGDRDAFAAALAAMHWAVVPAEEEGALRATCRNGAPDTAAVFRAAAQTGVQVRHLAKSQSSLEDLFSRLLQDARNGPR